MHENLTLTGPRTRPAAALAVICLSVLIISADATIVNIALPTLAQQLHASNSDLQWFTDAYILVLSGLLLAAGALSDRYGRRGALSLGLLIFAITSVVASQVHSTHGLIAGRAAMGIGAALIFPTTLSIITNMFTEPVRRAKAIALWAAMTGVGIAVGPLTGGFLLEHFWWGSIFLVNVPIAGIAIIGAQVFVPSSHDPARPPLDVAGLILSTAAIAILTYTIIEAPDVGWLTARTIIGFLIAAILLSAFGVWEATRTHPMLDLSVFTNARFSGASLAVTTVYLGVFGFIFLTTQYLQFIKAYSPLGTGARMLPVALALAAAGVLAPRLVHRLGTTVVVVTGLVMVAIGIAMGALFTQTSPYGELATAMMLLGAGMGFTSAPATESIMGSLSISKAGIGSAVNESTRELGATLGVAIIGSVFASIYTSHLQTYPAITTLPATARTAVGDSVAAAHQVITQMPPTSADALRTAVNESFLHGMAIGSLVAAGFVLTGAAAVAMLLPAHAPDLQPTPKQAAHARRSDGDPTAPRHATADYPGQI
jgi:EmrB/QacA subfamily drug resistance transporter